MRIKIMQLRETRRHTVMPTCDNGKGVSRPPGPTMVLDEPLTQHHLPSKTVRRHPSVIAELRMGRHIKTAVAHRLRQRLDLAGKSGR